MIPYTVDRRPDTNLTNVRMGIWLFLASEVMLFGALFSCYALLRTAATTWPSGRDVLQLPLGTANTIVLVTLSALIWRARRLPPVSAAARLWAATGLAVLFLAIKGVEYQREISGGMVAARSTFLALYFTLTALHAMHVAAGAIANIWAASGARRAGAALTAGRVEALALYWVFVDMVWLLIFVLLYVS
jgi:cytochrome c oxidase subunit 3